MILMVINIFDNMNIKSPLPRLLAEFLCLQEFVLADDSFQNCF